MFRSYDYAWTQGCRHCGRGEGGRGHGFLEQKIFLRKIGVDESDGVDEKSKKKWHKKEGGQSKHI